MQAKNQFAEYINIFEQKLETVIIDSVSTELYCRKYLAHLLKHKKYYLAIYADALNKLITHSAKKKEDIVLIDCGSGNGLLGIFAKFCGFKRVFLNDIDEKFINASEKLAKQLKIKIDDYIAGDVDSLKSYFIQEKPDAIVGTDVIEHIYDLNAFFKSVQQINKLMVSVFTTASNPFNPFKVKELKKLQLKDELEGTPNDHILFGETALEPFLKIREQIIRNRFSDLADNNVLTLAKLTRGMKETDIVTAVNEYNLTGKMPMPATGNNTSNPLNGSWTERILSSEEYISIYTNAGFTCEFYAGFYNDYETGLLSFVKKMLNAGITTLGKKISPYIVIVGFKK